MAYERDDDNIISPYYDRNSDEKDDDDLDYDYFDDDDLPEYNV